MTHDSKTPEGLIRQQAKLLGGNCYIKHDDLMPVIVLTTTEAAALIKKMKKKTPHDGLLAVRYRNQNDEIYIIPPDQVEFVYDTDGI